MTRPTTRAECLPGGWNVERPCPFVGCRYHLGLHVSLLTGRLVVHPDHPEVLEGELDGLPDTCALDVADRGEHTLEEIGQLLGVSRERVRQISDRGLAQFRRLATADQLGELEEALRHREAVWAPELGDDEPEDEAERHHQSPERITETVLKRAELELSTTGWTPTVEVSCGTGWPIARTRTVLERLLRDGRCCKTSVMGRDGLRSEWKLTPRHGRSAVSATP